MPKIKISQADEKILVGAILETWQEIGNDFMQLFDEEGITPDNESCVEGCIDADRLRDPKAEAVLESLLAKHTYSAVLAALSKIVTLV